MKKQAASARRAAQIEIARGAVSARNETRDERIERLRLRGLEAEVARMRQSRALARASKEELGYRQLFREGLELAREQLAAEVSASEDPDPKPNPNPNPNPNKDPDPKPKPTPNPNPN